MGGNGGVSSTSKGGSPAGGTTGGTAISDASASGGSGGGSGTDASTPDARETSDSAVGVGHPRRVVLCDEGNTRVSLLDLEKNTSIWQRPLPGMRDIQLVGNDRLGASSSEGYVELDLADGTIKKEVKGYANVQSLRRLPNGNTILGIGTDDSSIRLLELDSNDVPVPGHDVTFPTVKHLRLFRRTPQGTFLLGALSTLAEVNWNKEVVWQMTFQGDPLHIYQGLRLPDGTIAVSEGYGSSVFVVDPVAKKVLKTIGGTTQPEAATINPHFYAGFQILPNGHYVVTNWQNHGAGHGSEGIQLLEYDAAGTLVWKWKQDPNLVSSLHGVIVLDGLDTTLLHDDVNGILAPVTE
jgi:hypothetical protein